MTGMARDGGLLLPESIPDVTDQLPAWRHLTYAELAARILGLYADLPEAELRALVRRSYSKFRTPEVTPLVRVGHVHMLELHHGPTLAFKDIALQLLGNLFERFLAERGQTLNIVAATSGDTGSAAIHGVRGKSGIRIFVLHPHQRVSKAQERQMTTVLDDNVFNLALEGTFDECQAIVKALFNDLPFRDRHALGAVNSINWARIAAQVVYYFYGAFRAMDATGASEVAFSVPTGNFGDIFAGYLARRMGLPIRRLILATNENDILARCFTTGVYESRAVRATVSPSMDIQAASNFERYLYYHVGGDPQRVRDLMGEFARSGRICLGEAGAPPDGLFRAGSADKARTLATIRAFYDGHQYQLDPHTAAGVAVGLQNRERNVPLICLATAHPAKFGEVIRTALGSDLAHHPILNAMEGKPARMEVLPASLESVRGFIEARLGAGKA
jgi:threonine synthase